MSIAVIGAGAVGSLLAGLLARAGHERIALVARGSRYENLVEPGQLVVKSNYVGDFIVETDPLEAGPGRLALADSPSTAAELLKGPADALLLAVKSYHTEAALAQIARAKPPLVSPGTLLVSCQNGVDNEPAIAEAFGWTRTVGCVVTVAASLERRERLQDRRLKVAVAAYLDREGWLHCHRQPLLHLGLYGPDGAPLPAAKARTRAATALKRLAAALDAAGVKARLAEDISEKLWRKLTINAALNPLAALTGASVGQIARSQPLRELAVCAMEEAAAVGRACGQAIPDTVIERGLASMTDLPNFEPSMLQDLKAGKPLELEALLTALTSRARDRAIATPILDTFELLLKGMVER